MGKNIERLGGILGSRMTSTAKAVKGVPLELGTINEDYSLKTDSLKGSIGPDSYMVDLSLTHSNYNTLETEHRHVGDDHTHEGGIHKHRVPSVFRRIKPGDRVLVAWAGNEPIIVAIVVAGTTITN